MRALQACGLDGHRIEERIGDARTDLRADPYLLELDVGQAPVAPAGRGPRPGRLPGRSVRGRSRRAPPVVDGRRPVVVAVVAGDCSSRLSIEPRCRTSAGSSSSRRATRGASPRRSRRSRRSRRAEQLEITRRVEADPLEAQRRLVQAQARAQALDLRHRPTGIAPRQPLPEPFRKFESRQSVVPVRELAADLAQASLASAARRSCPCSSRAASGWRGSLVGPRRFGRPARRRAGECATAKRSSVDRGGHAQHPKQVEARVGQRVRDRLDERRKLVGRVVVDEDDLVVGVGENLRDAVQARARPGGGGCNRGCRCDRRGGPRSRLSAAGEVAPRAST